MKRIYLKLKHTVYHKKHKPIIRVHQGNFPRVEL